MSLLILRTVAGGDLHRSCGGQWAHGAHPGHERRAHPRDDVHELRRAGGLLSGRGARAAPWCCRRQRRRPTARGCPSASWPSRTQCPGWEVYAEVPALVGLDAGEQDAAAGAPLHERYVADEWAVEAAAAIEPGAASVFPPTCRHGQKHIARPCPSKSRARPPFRRGGCSMGWALDLIPTRGALGSPRLRRARNSPLAKRPRPAYAYPRATARGSRLGAVAGVGLVAGTARPGDRGGPRRLRSASPRRATGGGPSARAAARAGHASISGPVRGA